MSVDSPRRFTNSGDVFRRRLLLHELPAPEGTQRPTPAHNSPALQVLLDGFLHGSLLTLAVCTPQRDARFSRGAAQHRESFRAFLVSRPAAEPVVEDPAADAVPLAR